MSIVRVPFSLTSGGPGGYVIPQSAYPDGTSAYMTRAGVSGSSTKGTVWRWAKGYGSQSQQCIFFTRNFPTGYSQFQHSTYNGLGTWSYQHTSSFTTVEMNTTARPVDPTAWRLEMLAWDTTQGTAANRMRLYYNFDEVPWTNNNSGGAPIYPSSSLAIPFADSSYSNYLGTFYWGSPSNYLQDSAAMWGYCDGTQLTPSDVAEQDARGNTIPLDLITPGTFDVGSAGFLMDFADTGNYGKDVAPIVGSHTTARDCTVTGTWTQTNDSPTDSKTDGVGNKAVANPLYYHPTAGRLTLSNGNRSWEATTGSYWQNAALTIPVSSGKFIVACSMGDLTSGSVASGIGLSTIASFTPGTGGNAYPGGADFGSDSIGILDRSGVDFNELIHAIAGTTTNTGTQLAADDQFVIALDADAGKAWLGWWDDSASQLNWFDSGGTSRATDEPGSGTNATLTYTAGTQMLFSVFAIVASPTSLPSLLEEADWSFTKPTGFLELSTENLPAPAVTDPSAYFKTLLYTGNSTGSTAITGCQDASGTNWTPDLVWIKPRTFAADGRHCLYDQVRGANKRISSDNTNAEATDIDCLDSFDSGGFTLGADTANNLVNDSTYTYVAWCLKAGGSGSSNTDGDLTSTVSVADHGGFGILTYTGNGVSGATLGTGMTIPSGTNAWAIFKKTSAPNDWHVGYEINGTIGGMELNNTTGNSGVSNTVTNFHSDSGTTITITSGGVVNDTGASYVAYVFQQIPGFCAIGSYTANGNGDGPYVVVDDGGVGFRPAFVLFKDYAGAANWQIMDAVRDPYNPIGSELYPNTSGTESTAGAPFVDFTANGFKCRATGDPNNSGRSYIYLAFAEHPFGGDGVEQARAR